MTGFERVLYGDPEADLDAAWWELVSRHQLLTPPDGRAAPDWAAKIHIAVAPVYYHTYLYGAIVAAQLSDALVERGRRARRPARGRRGPRREGCSRREPRCAGTGSSSRPPGKPLSVESLARAVAAA